MSIEEVLAMLPEAQRARLQYAFDQEQTDHVEYEPGRFIGVNIFAFETESQVGAWSIGKL